MTGLVAVLGCGPAGLLTAHAVQQMGYTPIIYSRKQRSQIGGAQYLHEHIPGITSQAPDGVVTFEKAGTRTGYALKVYGDSNAPVSWDDFETGEHKVWNMRDAYEILWTMFEPIIADVPDLDRAMISSIGKQIPVLSTIPPRAYCNNANHHFKSQEVWISEERNCGPMWITYMGSDIYPWYRASNLWGYTHTEYSAPVGHTDAVRVRKPLWTDCDCLPWVHRLGRYGRWEKRQLIHHAYFGAREIMLHWGEG